MWKDLRENFSIRSSTNQVVHVIFIEHDGNEWAASFVYASLTPTLHEILWGNLKYFVDSNALPWLAIGDFNDFASASERQGGSGNIIRRCSRFQSNINDCGMVDFGFSGAAFTWSNNSIKKRLDRALASPEWKSKFLEARIIMLDT
ncbi:Exo_endo_phos domain-containing protein [Cephalotus follicularis]|uniref:Exo_endo_phos domain-containing protein n=1 Tax=Cephalotus follicularis TaxID=3775 RepID=A0A1Q3BZ29_CEPFO|nr:Exo_endo_phos domain-containing protein [Cephalotus follicularis]